MLTDPSLTMNDSTARPRSSSVWIDDTPTPRRSSTAGGVLRRARVSDLARWQLWHSTPAILIAHPINILLLLHTADIDPRFQSSLGMVSRLLVIGY